MLGTVSISIPTMIIAVVVFLACSASWNRCARRLHIHVNTLRYRMAKIGELTGRDPSRLDHLVDLHLALRVR